MRRLRVRLLLPLVAVGLVALMPGVALAAGPFIGQFHTVSTVASTVPGNGDVNPYGVAVVPRSGGKLVQGRVMVSNFNNSANLQGTGTTLVEISPGGSRTLFAQINRSLRGCPGGVGLTTALTVLSSGFVIVGSLPTADGTSATARAGCLIVLNAGGQVVETISNGLINGPWDLSSVDFGDAAVLFVTNVLNGLGAAHPSATQANAGTVVRVTLAIGSVPFVTSETVIGSGFTEKTDPSALVIGPTGVGLDGNGTLYVADSVNNRIAGIPNALNRGGSAGRGFTLSQNGALSDPLGLTIAPNGDVLTVNGNDSNIVEVSPFSGAQASHAIGSGGGSLFGLAVKPGGNGIYFVDDVENALNLFH